MIDGLKEKEKLIKLAKRLPDSVITKTDNKGKVSYLYTNNFSSFEFMIGKTLHKVDVTISSSQSSDNELLHKLFSNTRKT